MTETPQAMDTARSYVELTRRKRELDRELGGVKKELDKLEAKLLEHIEAGAIPESFKLDGANVYTREQLWASPKDGDHARLATVLEQLGMVEYLPRTVNSQSISAYVREHLDESGEIADLDPLLAEALNITRSTKAVVNG